MNTHPYVSPPNADPGGFWTSRLVIGVLCAATAAVLVALSLPVNRSAGEDQWRAQCKSNLKHIGIALYNYQEFYGSPPPAYTVGENGQPLHSWRTLLLPYMEHPVLYDQLDLSKSWDDPVNRDILNDPAVAPGYSLRCVLADLDHDMTTYMAVVTPSSDGQPPTLTGLAERGDSFPGSRGSLVVIEVPANQAVHWAQPIDLGREFLMNFDTETQFPHPGGAQALFSDGSVHLLSGDLPQEERRAVLPDTSDAKAQTAGRG